MNPIYRPIILLILFFGTGCSNTEEAYQYGPATQELISLLDSNSEVKSMLISSLEKARQINPDPNTNPAQTLDEYLQFVSYCEKAMPWALMKKEEYPEIFDHIFQSLACFYFLIDQPLPELENRGLVNNSLQYAEPFASWLVTFSKSWGAYLDSEESWNEEYYQAAMNDPNFGLQHGWYEDPSNWKTFNDFFARHLRSPDMRPVASPSDSSVVVSFADSEPQGVWAIDSNSFLIANDGIAVKSATLRSIPNLIGEDSEYKDAFANGTFTHSFLNVNDYHRYHFPMSGTVREVRLIQGINPTGGKLWWDADNGRYAFDPSAKTGWQTIETRGSVILETEGYGLVALLPIGMVAIGSVNFEDTIKPGIQVKKGDMLGNFAFGGSDFIMIFQEGVNFTIDSPKTEDRETYQHILMGERLGTISKN